MEEALSELPGEMSSANTRLQGSSSRALSQEWLPAVEATELVVLCCSVLHCLV